VRPAGRPDEHGYSWSEDAAARTCINWIRTLPCVKAWNREYASLGLVVIGVHSPEFEFSKRAENIDRGVRDHG
jgi:hypothetical protein